jgi:CubicO group peptidase (beta-lactamase class C family)
VRDLLSHRTGLGTYGGDLLWYGTPYTAAEVVRRARHLEPEFPFRAGYGYSNIAFIAAGEVVAAVSGEPWPVFVEERILAPLGMTETLTSTSRLAGRSNVATPHNERDGVMVGYPWYSWDAMAAGGGIISSAADMARWLRLQLGRGMIDSLRLFSEAQSAAMWTPHNPRSIGEEARQRFPSTHFRAYALGWEVMDYLGRMVVRHGGAYDGMYSRVALVPEEGLGVVILTNAMTDVQDALAYVTLDTFLGAPFTDWSADFLPRYRRARADELARRAAAVESRVSGTRPSLALDRYAGTYGGPMYGDAAVSADSGRLVLRFLPAPDFVGDLSHLHHDVFRVSWRHRFPWFDDGTVQFVLGADGAVAEMKVDVPNGDFWFTELEFRRRR